METGLRNDGQKLREILKLKGFDMTSVAKSLNVSRAIVEKDSQKPMLSRKALAKYTPLLFRSIDAFYMDETSIPEKGMDYSVGESQGLVYKDELIESMRETIREQRKHIDTLTSMLRFFPSAVQQATITA
ncbi:hypothetical protein [Spirosoma endophyticum]|uniref:Uncharacterized protein n=1 Tax=Spirosoma endophyticum TaxID=662367 RepID=A0A1I1U922_9BACT|nr:hypothetical protein [Spirosoma endophyticum]SFD67135.1 hypothetical protein SAMN05216167_106168 [Spirosoma endophyticum]